MGDNFEKVQGYDKMPVNKQASAFPSGVAMVQWNHLHLGIPEHMGLNPDYSVSGDWASTWGNSYQVGGLSDRSPLGNLL